ncbi:MAG: hypothetical protein JWL90_4426 [Chthoniobacteraceae bacterium]|nr:hypothetical protein [Chthoniobacteraceae bacterium]
MALFCAVTIHAADTPGAPPPTPGRIFAKNGAPLDENYFPVAVWLQAPRNALRYKAAGINLYVGLWNGPTPAQLRELSKAGMPVICAQKKELKDDSIIAGWMHGDEPDNAQPQGKEYGPPILPEKIVSDYKQIQSIDPARPVMLNLGQGVAWDQYIGRGVRRNHSEDYPEYLKGCDIASFDIYPVTHDSPEVAGKLEFVAKGVERLVDWTDGKKPVWSCIECTHIGNPERRASPEQVKAEVWMALIRGARGLIYFAHEFKPSFKEAALLDDAEMLKAVTEINQQVQELAAVLNSPAIDPGLTVESSNGGIPIAGMLKRSKGGDFVFAVNLRNESAHARISVPGVGETMEAAVLGETRKITLKGGLFTDAFAPYSVHLYQLTKPR